MVQRTKVEQCRYIYTEIYIYIYIYFFAMNVMDDISSYIKMVALQDVMYIKNRG
jgi:hypothetical protein